MKTKEAYHQQAEELAKEISCNVDCARYRTGTCIVDDLNYNKCYRYKSAYDYYINSLQHNDCVSERQVAHCTLCDEYQYCKIAEIYDNYLL